MPRYPIDYYQRPVAPTPAFPIRTRTPTPIVPVILRSGRLAWPCYAIVDSGADDCLFPASFAARVGLNLTSGSYYEFGGAGSLKQPAWFFNITLNIGTVITYEAPIGFSPALDQTRIGLLGQNGFFDKFRIDLDLRNDVFYIEA